MIHPEERKQRKRKHSDSKSSVAEAADDDFYKRKNALLDKEEADYDEAINNAPEPEEDQEEELNVSRPFNMKKFREKLREGDFITG